VARLPESGLVKYSTAPNDAPTIAAVTRRNRTAFPTSRRAALGDPRRAGLTATGFMIPPPESRSACSDHTIFSL
jgi:hypothetical protein